MSVLSLCPSQLRYFFLHLESSFCCIVFQSMSRADRLKEFLHNPPLECREMSKAVIEWHWNVFVLVHLQHAEGGQNVVWICSVGVTDRHDHLSDPGGLCWRCIRNFKHAECKDGSSISRRAGKHMSGMEWTAYVKHWWVRWCLYWWHGV